jgi:hypothetical protein
VTLSHKLVRNKRMENTLEVSESYMNEVITSASTKLVGEILSNFDSISNQEELKKMIKNTVYQNFRDLKAQVRAFDCGVRFIRHS